MRKGREIFLYSSLFVAGDFFGGWLTLPPWLYLILCLAVSLLALRSRRLSVILAAFFLLGAASVQISRMPPAGHRTLLEERCTRIRERASSYLEATARRGGAVDAEGIALLKALSTGDRSDIPFALREDYRRSGAMHLLALSGLHAGIIYKILCGILFFLGWSPASRGFRRILVLLFFWGFALMTGMSPSIARASLMITLYEISPSMRSGRDGLRSLAAAALLICLADPEAPRSLGFQLSFCACLSLFTLFPRLKGLLSTRMLPLRRLWELLCVAISCQAATAPLSYLCFGTFPRYFLVTNLLALPLAAAVLYLLAATLLLTPFPYLSGAALRLLGYALSLLNGVASTVASL